MAHLGATIARLAKLRGDHAAGTVPRTGDPLKELVGFGSNPGTLLARTYMPSKLPPKAALVVVLHGCTQNAAAYNHGAGWSHLADEQGFAVLFPEQQRSNNPNMCFNWFSPGDTRRDGGEALSIRQMIAAMISRNDIDPDRVFITGLSAGGAMTSVMLATYPEVFAGGAVIAGLPFGVAHSVPDALARMRGQGHPSDAHLVKLVHEASDYQGKWPSVSVWHGTADATVSQSNADRILAQWRGVHGLAHAAATQDTRTTRQKRHSAIGQSYQAKLTNRTNRTGG